MEGFKTLFGSSKFPWSRETKFLEIWAWTLKKVHQPSDRQEPWLTSKASR